MALTKAEKAIIEFNNEVTALALTKLDKEKLAKTIAADLQRHIMRDVRTMIDRRLNIGKLITDELSSENTKIGRNFQGIIADITHDMVETIRTVKLDDKQK